MLCITNSIIKHRSFIYTKGNVKTVLFQVIQQSKNTLFSSTWPIDRTLSGATIPGESGPESDGNKGVFRIPQSSGNTGASASDCFVSYIGHSLEESYPFAKVQSVNSATHLTRPADHSNSSNYNCYHRHLHIPQLFQLFGMVQICVYLFHKNGRINKMTNSFFLVNSP